MERFMVVLRLAGPVVGRVVMTDDDCNRGAVWRTVERTKDSEELA